MPLTIHRAIPRLRADQAGAVRVGNTRVLFVLVVQAYKDGAKPEDIVRMYDTLTLTDAYAAVTYYLQYTDEVEAYLTEYDRNAEVIRRKIEERQGSHAGKRDELLRRLAERASAKAGTFASSTHGESA